ncbi:MAG: hypothetical protein KatS3mg059_1072 [Thermomicrobiales bacterium]|nr:MAG: hypothetical protein KatS3mg059_1072 [Thermomicrobiales bacterium]
MRQRLHPRAGLSRLICVVSRVPSNARERGLSPARRWMSVALPAYALAIFCWVVSPLRAGLKPRAHTDKPPQGG